MKVTQLEGTPEEIADYMQRLSAANVSDADGSAEITPSGEGQVGGTLDESDMAWLKRFVWSRGSETVQTQRIEDYLTRVIDAENVMIEAGTSTRTASGESDYLMVRDDGPRRYGAVVYVNPRSAKLNFRLLEADVDDVRDRVTVRNIVKGQHHYRINLPLREAEDVDLALELTKRALAKVRD
jgi:hypothetical protein